MRVISATARNLGEDVKSGRFREDLFFRLNVFSICLPPLRERMEDIPLLVPFFIARYADKFGKKLPVCDKSSMSLLLSNRWHGNVRELENVIERAMVLCEGEFLLPKHLPDYLLKTQESASAPEWMDTLSIKRGQEQMERALISKALEQTAGNRTKAAQLLEISHRALMYKLKEYGFSGRAHP